MTLPPALSFGPPTSQWTYDRSTRTYDLTRAQTPTLTIPTVLGPEDTHITIAPARTALVIVDMQNFFLSPRCRAHPKGLAAVEPTIELVRRAREVGVQVIWLNWGLTDADLATMPAGVQRGFSRSLISGSLPLRAGLGSDLGSDMGRTLFADTWNAALFPPLAALVQPTDIHCAKNRMSGLWSADQPLHKVLSGEKRYDTLLFTGVNTDQCVLGTLTDAYNAGWDCVLVRDCAATTTTVGAEEVVGGNVANSYGFVVDSAGIVRAKLEVV